MLREGQEVTCKINPTVKFNGVIRGLSVDVGDLLMWIVEIDVDYRTEHELQYSCTTVPHPCITPKGNDDEQPFTSK